MFYKKIALCSLFLSGQALGMLVNPIDKRHIQIPKQKPNLEKFSYEQFLKNQRPLIQELPIEILPLIMKHLDSNSNDQFLMTCERFYRTYGDKGVVLSPEAYMRKMISASRANDKKRVELLIKYETELQKRQRELILQYCKPDYSYLHEARKSILQYFNVIDCSNRDAVMEIYKKKYDSECSDFTKLKTGIIFKELVENPVLCQLLLEQGLSPNIKEDEHGRTALMDAAQFNHIETLKVLLTNKQIDPNIQSKKTGGTALTIAALNNQIEAVKLLLADPRVEPNIQDLCGTALILAIIGTENNDIEAVKLLLANPRVNPNIQGARGYTALILAIAGNQTEAVKLLLADPRINPNIQDEIGETALMVAAKYDHIEEVKLLLAHPKLINPNIQNMWGKTALMIAAKCNSIEVLKLLLADSRVNPDIQDKKGYTALKIAAKYNQTEVVKLLLTHELIHLSKLKYGKTA